MTPDGRHEPPGTTRPRTLPVLIRYYTRTLNRFKRFVLGDKPDALKHLGEIDQRAWRQYQVHLKRTTPLERAQFYARQMEARKIKTVATLARVLREPPQRLWRALRLLELPEPVRRYLEEHRTPDMIRYFTERRLRSLLNIHDPRTIWRRFQQMLEEARRKGGIWGPSDPEPSMKPK